MSVGIDLGDMASPFGSVHTRHKIEVGDRLSLGGRAVAYGQHVLWEGPTVESAHGTKAGAAGAGSASVRITFAEDSLGPAGLLLRNASAGWQLCCDGAAGGTGCVGGVAAQVSNSAIVVSVAAGQSCKAVKYVQYAWSAFPCEFEACSVYTVGSGEPRVLLPAAPFNVSVTAPAVSER